MKRFRFSFLNNALYLLAPVSLLILCALFFSLSWLGYDASQGKIGGVPITVFSAAGMRYPMDEISAAYTTEYGTPIQLQYGGSNTMLSQLEVGQAADLYIAADDFYIDLAGEKGLVKERIPIASQTPIIVTKKGNPLQIREVADLYNNPIRYAIGDPQAAAIGKKTREALAGSVHWDPLKSHATVLKPTVNEIATAVSLGSVDAGIVWDSTAAHYGDLEVVRDPLLAQGVADAQLAVTSASDNPTGALHFARYITATDRGLPAFAQHGFTPIQGDQWEEIPQITFYAGAVNRRAVQRAIAAFEKREGIKVNTVYNGCGILTAQMRSLHKNQGDGFPDSFMACDVYYMDAVQDLFMPSVNISDTDIVMVVSKNNPKGIHSLQDLSREGIRVAVGQPRQCTIGTLTRRLLIDAGIAEDLERSGNIVTETTSSALLVPNVVTQSADVALAYRVDAHAERDHVEIIPIISPMAKAVQPFGISKQSKAKRLNARLFDAISSAKDNFLEQGFGWRLVEGERPAVVAPRSPSRDQPAP